MDTRPAAPGPRPGHGNGRRATRWLEVSLGGLWLADGALQLQPFMFTRAFAAQVITPNATGQPRAVGWPVLLAAHLIEPRTVLFNACAASIQLLIGTGLLWRPTVRTALALSFGWALGVWWIGEGLGGILTGSASPLKGAPGAALLYLLAGLIIWPPGGEGGARPARGGALGERGTRIAWAMLWLGSAALWLLPADRAPQAVSQAIAAAPSGAAWLSHIQGAAAVAASGRGLDIAIAAAAVSALIGLSVLLDRWSAPLLTVSVVTALSCWLLGQGLGGMLTGTATDPGTGPLLVLLAVSLYQIRPRQRPGESRRLMAAP